MSENGNEKLSIIDEVISHYEENDLSLNQINPEILDSIKIGVENNVIFIRGLPGTGKSTIISAIANIAGIDAINVSESTSIESILNLAQTSSLGVSKSKPIFLVSRQPDNTFFSNDIDYTNTIIWKGATADQIYNDLDTKQIRYDFSSEFGHFDHPKLKKVAIADGFLKNAIERSCGSYRWLIEASNNAYKRSKYSFIHNFRNNDIELDVDNYIASLTFNFETEITRNLIAIFKDIKLTFPDETKITTFLNNLSHESTINFGDRFWEMVSREKGKHSRATEFDKSVNGVFAQIINRQTEKDGVYLSPWLKQLAESTRSERKNRITELKQIYLDNIHPIIDEIPNYDPNYTFVALLTSEQAETFQLAFGYDRRKKYEGESELGIELDPLFMIYNINSQNKYTQLNKMVRFKPQQKSTQRLILLADRSYSYPTWSNSAENQEIVKKFLKKDRFDIEQFRKKASDDQSHLLICSYSSHSWFDREMHTRALATELVLGYIGVNNYTAKRAQVNRK